MPGLGSVLVVHIYVQRYIKKRACVCPIGRYIAKEGVTSVDSICLWCVL